MLPFEILKIFFQINHFSFRVSILDYSYTLATVLGLTKIKREWNFSSLFLLSSPRKGTLHLAESRSVFSIIFPPNYQASVVPSFTISMWRELFGVEVPGHLLDTVVILVAVDCGSINL